MFVATEVIFLFTEKIQQVCPFDLPEKSVKCPTRAPGGGNTAPTHIQEVSLIRVQMHLGETAFKRKRGVRLFFNIID